MRMRMVYDRFQGDWNPNIQSINSMQCEFFRTSLVSNRLPVVLAVLVFPWYERRNPVFLESAAFTLAKSASLASPGLPP